MSSSWSVTGTPETEETCLQDHLTLHCTGGGGGGGLVAILKVHSIYFSNHSPKLFCADVKYISVYIIDL